MNRKTKTKEAKKRKKGVNGRAKGMQYEYEVRDILKMFIPDDDATPEKLEELRQTLLVAFRAAKRNNEASAGKDNNDLAVDLDAIPDSLVAKLRTFPLHVECKNRVTVSLKDAYEQSVENLIRCSHNKRIVLITKETFKHSHPNFTGRSMVTMALEDFLDLLFNGNLFPKENREWRKVPERLKRKRGMTPSQKS